MQLREYRTADVDKLAELFYQTVHSVNAKGSYRRTAECLGKERAGSIYKNGMILS